MLLNTVPSFVLMCKKLLIHLLCLVKERALSIVLRLLEKRQIPEAEKLNINITTAVSWAAM